MCIAFWYILPKDNKTKIDKPLKYLLLFNREEWLNRPTAQLAVYDQNLIYGKDLKAKGTWLAINLKTGMLAFLTNRDRQNRKTYLDRTLATIQLIQHHLPQSITNCLNLKNKSRGQLILQIVSQDEKQSFLKLFKEHPAQEHELELQCKQKSQLQVEMDILIPEKEVQQSLSEYLDALGVKTLLQKSQYPGFNMFYGSLHTLEFRVVGKSLSKGKFEQVAEGVGSLSSCVDTQTEKVQKQQHGMDKIKEIAENFNEGNIGESQLIDELHKIATSKFQSEEKFFDNLPEERQLFIDKYEPLKRGLGYLGYIKPSLKGQLRGTRTSTIILVIGSQLRIIEKTYE